MPPKYVPILKGKEGEFTALQALSTSVQDAILPLIELPRVPYDYSNERPVRSLEEHALGVLERLTASWTGRPFYFDVPWSDDADDQEDAALAITNVLADETLVIPVIATTKSTRYLAAVAGYVRRMRRGVCIRLSISDFEEESATDPEESVDRLMTAVGVGQLDEADLILDLGDLGEDVGRAILITRSIIGLTPRAMEWRRITLAGASFPENLSEVNAASTTTLPRVEWALWQRLRRRRGSLREDTLFGDYGIANPVVAELDPRTMRMSASIRYTTPVDWLVVKGRNVRQYGFDQFYELARILVRLPEYSGEDFCWGDRFIARCARGEIGPGNATTWRKVGTNHHITLVARNLASPVAV